MRYVAFVIVLLGFSSDLAARDIHVNNLTGDNRRDGNGATRNGQFGGPTKTISHALAIAKKGDRIVIAATGQPYREGITVQAGPHTGVPTEPFVIVGNGATLDGSAVIPRQLWEALGEGLFRFRPGKKSHQMLFLDDKPLKRRPVERDEGLPLLDPLEWCLWNRAIYFQAEKNKTPANYNLSCSKLTVGITLYEARHVVISDLVVQGFQLDGVNAHDSVFDANLVGLTCRGNGRSGVSVGGASRVNIIACLIGNNGTAQVRAEGFSRTEITNCDVIGTAIAPAVVRTGGKVFVAKDAATNP